MKVQFILLLKFLAASSKIISTCTDMKEYYNEKNCCTDLSSQIDPLTYTDSTQKSTGTLKLAVVVPMSGDLSLIGSNMKIAAEVAAKEINTQGLLNVSINIKDSKCGPSVTMEHLQSMTSEIVSEEVQGIVGAACSGISRVVVPIAIENKIMMISPANTDPDFTTMDTKGYYARTAPSDELQGIALAKILNQDNISSISIITYESANTYAVGIAKTILNAFKLIYQGTVREIVLPGLSYSLGTSYLNYTKYAELLVQSDVDAYVGILIPENACEIMNAVKNANGFDKPWYFTDGFRPEPDSQWSTGKNFDTKCQLGGKLDGFKGVAPASINSLTGQAIEAFKTEYASMHPYGAGVFSFNPPYVPQTYDATMIMAISAAKYGTSGEEISSGVIGVTQGDIDCIGVACIPLAMEGKNINYIGASGNIKLDKNGDPTDVLYDIFKIEGDSSSVIGTIRP